MGTRPLGSAEAIGSIQQYEQEELTLVLLGAHVWETTKIPVWGIEEAHLRILQMAQEIERLRGVIFRLDGKVDELLKE